MKKTLFFTLLLLAVVLLLMPAAVGVSAENQFRRLAANVEEAAPGYRFVVDEYERGWFSSRARYHLELGPQLVAEMLAGDGDIDQLPTFASEAKILHGPIFFAGFGEPGVSLLPALAHSIDEVTVTGIDGEKIAIPGAISTRLGFFGHHVNVIAFDALTSSFDAGGQPAEINWEGMHLETHFNSSLDEVAFSGEIGAMGLVMNAIRVEIGTLQLGGEQQLTEFGFWSGDQSGRFAGFAMTTGDGPDFSMGQLSWSATISTDDRAVDQHVDLSVDFIELEGWRSGTARLLVTIDGLDAAAIGALIEKPERIFSAGGDGAVGDIFGRFAFFEQLLAHGPSVDLEELSIVTPDGVLSVRARINVPETAQGTLAEMLANLDASANLQLPAALAELLALHNPEAGAQLEGLVAAGLLLEKEGVLIMDVALKGALLTINGQPMALPFLL
ncbi:MAG: DUF945 family protein [Gammaproteobacteria bacterium]|nr:DUF945 family protein [Gammaproteobacteria bacterium]